MAPSTITRGFLLAVLLGVLLAILLAATAARAAVVNPIVDVYTMGVGEELFTRFGHAAICVSDDKTPEGRCYNYGTADFSTPGPLTVGIVRGNAQFWVSVVSQPRMLAWYKRQDRSVYRQRLLYDPKVTPWLVEVLHRADERSATFYNYHHFNDNCTTRIRDLLDNATQNRMAKATTAVPSPPLRHFVSEGLAGRPLLLAISQLFLGRSIDRPSTRWQAMFLPEILRAEVTTHFGIAPEVLYTRQAKNDGERAARSAGTWLLVGIGALLGAVILFAGFRRRPRLGLVPTGIILGFVGLFLTALAVFSPLTELRYNEALLLCWPTDLLLPLVSLRTAGRYAALRLFVLLVGAILAATGLLIQPLIGAIALCGLPLIATFFVSRAASS
jgi:hypothetical protein